MTIRTTTAGLLAGIAGLAMTAAAAQATPVAVQQLPTVMAFGDGTSVVQIAKKKKRLRRFRKKRRGFSHFHNGFYYAQPFWEYGDFYEDDYDFYEDDDYDEPDYAEGGDDHEDWCRRKYRSYKVRTNTWTDYDGNTRRCISPFN